MSERDELGHFVKGNKASPGRTKRPTEIEYLNILKQGVTPDDWQKIVRTAVSLAMAGDWKAREWLSNYLVGKPPQILELRGADALLLSEVLKRFSANGFTAGDVFEVMLQQMAESDMAQLESGATYE